jgi:hypothetical protein
LEVGVRVMLLVLVGDYGDCGMEVLMARFDYQSLLYDYYYNCYYYN